jgi:integrase/recombinase XerD
VGDAPRRRQRQLVGTPAVGRPRVRDLPVHHRSGDRGPTHRPAAVAQPTCDPVPLLRRRHRRLLAATDILSTPLRRATYRTLLGLLSVTGMRIGEAIRLDRAISIRAGLLVVRSTKFGKDRQVPLHDHDQGADRLPEVARPAAARAPTRRRCSSPPRGPGCATATSLDLPQARRPRGADPRSDVMSSQDPRSAPFLCGQHRARWLPHRRRRAGSAAAAVDLPRPRPPRQHLLVSVRRARAARTGRTTLRRSPGGRPMSALAPTLQAFFTDRLIRQRQASPNTIACLPRRVQAAARLRSEHTGKPPSTLDIADLDADTIGRSSTISSRARQQRLDPQRPARRDPVTVPVRRPAPSRARRGHRTGAGHPTQTVRPGADRLPHPTPRSTRCSPHPTPRTWTGRRDHALITARDPDRPARLGAHRAALQRPPPGIGAHVACHGKGRKDRITPLTRDTVDVLKAGSPNVTDSPTSRCSHHVVAARCRATRSSGVLPLHRPEPRTAATLHGKKISAHVLRHTAAMRCSTPESTPP